MKGLKVITRVIETLSNRSRYDQADPNDVNAKKVETIDRLRKNK